MRTLLAGYCSFPIRLLAGNFSAGSHFFCSIVTTMDEALQVGIVIFFALLRHVFLFLFSWHAAMYLGKLACSWLAFSLFCGKKAGISVSVAKYLLYHEPFGILCRVSAYASYFPAFVFLYRKFRLRFSHSSSLQIWSRKEQYAFGHLSIAAKKNSLVHLFSHT